MIFISCRNKNKVIVKNPTQWDRDDFEGWQLNRYPTSTAIYTSSLASATAVTTATQGGSTEPAVGSATKDADDVLIRWRCERRNPT